jgi:cholesterol transport system auxiliary component
MLTQDLRQWLGRSGLLATVVDTGSLARADLSLEGNVAALYGDYSGGEGLAVAEMQFLVLDERAPETPILFSRTYRREVPVAPGDPKALVLGLRRAVSAIYGELEEDLRGLPALR